MDETLLAQSKTFGGDRLDGDQTEIQDQLQLYVRDWDEEQALNIYKQHRELFSYLSKCESRQ